VFVSVGDLLDAARELLELRADRGQLGEIRRSGHGGQPSRVRPGRAIRTVGESVHGYDERFPMLSRLDLRGANADLSPLTARGDAVDATAVEGMRAIIAEVRGRGDDALRDLTEQFDGCTIDDLRVPGDELLAALQDAPADVRATLEYAREEVTAYHEAQLGGDVRVERNGVLLRELVVPVDRAGLYVPGGRATYPSTVLMTAIPARVAGVPEIALCVPPDPNGRVPAVTLAAAALAGVDEVYRVGGAQAIAALAYGTETIRPVDVIVGPGNMYVTAAKREVAGIVGIESLAGPSELVVVADD